MATGHLRYRHEIVFNNNAGSITIDIDTPSEGLTEADEAFIRTIGLKALSFQAEQGRRMAQRRRHAAWKRRQSFYAQPLCWPGFRAAPAPGAGGHGVE